MFVKWKGRDLGEFSGMPSLQEARKIRSMVGMLPEEWLTGLQKADPDCFIALVVVMLARNGEQVRFDSVDGEYTDLEIELSEKEKEAQNESVATEQINPTIVRILDRLGVKTYSSDDIKRVVMEELTAAETAGKDE